MRKRPANALVEHAPISPVLRAQTTYPFIRLNEAAAGRRAAGLEVIDFGMGDPREPTDPRIIEALRDGVRERMGYPVYERGAQFAGARVELLPLREENGFLPDLATVPADTWRRAALVWVNYPNNPTCACAPLELYGRKRELILGVLENKGVRVACSEATMYLRGTSALRSSPPRRSARGPLESWRMRSDGPAATDRGAVRCR